MLKKITVALAASLALVGAPLTSLASDIQTIVDSTYGLYDDRDQRICTGQFYVSSEKEDLFLTAAHCVEMKEVYSVRKQTRDDKLDLTYEEIIYLKPIRVKSKEDVAVLSVILPDKVDFSVVDIMEVGEVELSTGVPVLASTIPALPVEPNDVMVTGGFYTGPVKAVLSANKGELFTRATVAMDNGSSGGGLYAQVDGEWKLIGTANAGSPYFPYGTIWSSLENVREVVGLVKAAASTREAQKEDVTETTREILSNK